QRFVVPLDRGAECPRDLSRASYVRAVPSLGHFHVCANQASISAAVAGAHEAREGFVGPTAPITMFRGSSIQRGDVQTVATGAGPLFHRPCRNVDPRLVTGMRLESSGNR